MLALQKIYVCFTKKLTFLFKKSQVEVNSTWLNDHPLSSNMQKNIYVFRSVELEVRTPHVPKIPLKFRRLRRAVVKQKGILTEGEFLQIRPLILWDFPKRFSGQLGSLFS